MSFDYIRKTYGVPAKKGGRVTYGGKPGTITSATHYVHVRFDGGNKAPLPIHPTDDRLRYMGDTRAAAPGHTDLMVTPESIPADLGVGDPLVDPQAASLYKTQPHYMQALENIHRLSRERDEADDNARAYQDIARQAILDFEALRTENAAIVAALREITDEAKRCLVDAAGDDRTVLENVLNAADYEAALKAGGTP